MKSVVKFLKGKSEAEINAILDTAHPSAVWYLDGDHPFGPRLDGSPLYGFPLPDLRGWTYFELKPYQDIPRYKYQDIRFYRKGNPFKVGQKVKFAEEEKLWTVRAVQDEYAILKSGKYYTIVDTIEQIRGPDDHYGVGYESDEEISDAMRRLTDEDAEFGIEISHRHRIPLRMTEVADA